MSFLWFFLISLSAISAGNTVLELFIGKDIKMRKTVNDCFVYRMGFAGGIGFGSLAYAVLDVGLIGWLNKPVLIGLVALFAAVGIFSFRSLWAAAAQNIKKISSSFRFSFMTFCLLGFLAFISLIALMDVATPEISNDALCYHLSWPKYFLKVGAVGYFNYDPNSLYPFLMEMLYTLGLSLADVSLAKAMQFVMGIIAVFALYGFCRKFISREYSLIAAAGFLLSPVVFNQWGITYVEVGLAAFSLLAFLSFLEWMDQWSLRWIALAGIFTGFALSVKLLGLMTFVVITAGILITVFKKTHRSDAIKAFIVFGSLAFVFSCIWYFRMYHFYGNPVYPYFNSLFDLPVSAGRGVTNYDVANTGMGAGIIQYMLLPWNVTMHPERFEGLGAQIGVLFLAFVPASFLAIRRYPVAKSILFIVWGYLTIWFLLAQNSRFLIPIIPLLSVLIAFGFSELVNQRRWIRILASFLLISIFALNSALAFYNNRNLIPLTLGRETAEDFLKKTERSYDVALWVNQSLPENSKILNVGEVRVFYFDRNLVRERFYRDAVRYDQGADKNFDLLMERLKKDGFTHILFVSADKADEPSSPIHALLSDPNLRAKYLKELYHAKSAAKGDPTPWDYSVYEIKSNS